MGNTYGNVLHPNDAYSWSNVTVANTSSTADIQKMAAERAKYKRHMEAIFATDCVCEDATCPSCIAEHALFYEGDHDLVQR